MSSVNARPPQPIDELGRPLGGGVGLAAGVEQRTQLGSAAPAPSSAATTGIVFLP